MRQDLRSPSGTGQNEWHWVCMCRTTAFVVLIDEGSGASAFVVLIDEEQGTNRGLSFCGAN
jgi:hypothetical protein